MTVDYCLYCSNEGKMSLKRKDSKPIPHHWDASMSLSAALLLTPDGDLYLYCDEILYSDKLKSGLLVGQRLWGAVDVYGCCVQLKSETLSRPFEGIL